MPFGECQIAYSGNSINKYTTFFHGCQLLFLFAKINLFLCHVIRLFERIRAIFTHILYHKYATY